MRVDVDTTDADFNHLYGENISEDTTAISADENKDTSGRIDKKQ